MRRQKIETETETDREYEIDMTYRECERAQKHPDPNFMATQPNEQVMRPNGEWMRPKQVVRHKIPNLKLFVRHLREFGETFCLLVSHSHSLFFSLSLSILLSRFFL